MHSGQGKQKTSVRKRLNHVRSGCSGDEKGEGGEERAMRDDEGWAAKFPTLLIA